MYNVPLMNPENSTMVVNTQKTRREATKGELQEKEQNKTKNTK